MSVPMQERQIRTFQDILRALQEEPSLREQLRLLLLTEELLRLPEEVAKLTAAVSRLEQQVAKLTEDVSRLEQQVSALAEAQQRTERRLEELAAAQARTERRLEELAGAVGNLQGWQMEEDVRRRPLRYLRRLVANPRVLEEEQLLALAKDLPEADIDALLDADLVVIGEKDGQMVYVVAEVSRTARLYDVDRAADRAERLGRAVKEAVLAAVIGDRARPAAIDRARERQLWQVIGRQVWAPGEALPDDLVADGPDEGPSA